ncbi:hypothetical protein [Maribacter sp. 6B07]|uniref:hypothetical protein n=1 Tax=Maribacter sp. 6B07 TaxID=2045442 RepID=UPI0015D4EC0B|nr:hypothetical protein [Maribacter sp. 6B07]
MENAHHADWWQNKETLNKKLSGTRITFSILPKVRIVIQLIIYTVRIICVESRLW